MPRDDSNKGSTFQATVREGFAVGHGSKVENVSLTFNEPKDVGQSLDEEARHHYELGLSHFAAYSYTEARQSFGQALTKGRVPPEIHYYLALALLQGRSPRKLSRPEVQAAERQLVRAMESQPEAGHTRLLLAFVKQEAYAANGLRVRPPTVADLVASVGRGKLEPRRLEELSNHAPITSFLQKILRSRTRNP